MGFPTRSSKKSVSICVGCLDRDPRLGDIARNRLDRVVCDVGRRNVAPHDLGPLLRKVKCHCTSYSSAAMPGTFRQSTGSHSRNSAMLPRRRNATSNFIRAANHNPTDFSIACGGAKGHNHYLEPVTTAVLPARDMHLNENQGRGAGGGWAIRWSSYLPPGGGSDRRGRLHSLMGMRDGIL